MREATALGTFVYHTPKSPRNLVQILSAVSAKRNSRDRMLDENMNGESMRSTIPDRSHDDKLQAQLTSLRMLVPTKQGATMKL
jgi:hypothetical protein